MAVEDPATQGAKASAAVELTLFSENILPSTPEGLMQKRHNFYKHWCYIFFYANPSILVLSVTFFHSVPLLYVTWLRINDIYIYHIKSGKQNYSFFNKIALDYSPGSWCTEGPHHIVPVRAPRMMAYCRAWQESCMRLQTWEDAADRVSPQRQTSHNQSSISQRGRGLQSRGNSEWWCGEVYL